MQPASSPFRYFAGLDVHRDTIVACVYDQDRHRICYRAEFRANDVNVPIHWACVCHVWGAPLLL